jgi:hypothetical protein
LIPIYSVRPLMTLLHGLNELFEYDHSQGFKYLNFLIIHFIFMLLRMICLTELG